MWDGVSQNIGAAAVLQYWLGELDGHPVFLAFGQI